MTDTLLATIPKNARQELQVVRRVQPGVAPAILIRRMRHNGVAMAETPQTIKLDESRVPDLIRALQGIATPGFSPGSA